MRSIASSGQAAAHRPQPSHKSSRKPKLSSFKIQAFAGQESTQPRQLAIGLSACTQRSAATAGIGRPDRLPDRSLTDTVSFPLTNSDPPVSSARIQRWPVGKRFKDRPCRCRLPQEGRQEISEFLDISGGHEGQSRVKRRCAALGNPRCKASDPAAQIFVQETRCLAESRHIRRHEEMRKEQQLRAEMTVGALPPVENLQAMSPIICPNRKHWLLTFQMIRIEPR